MDVTAKIPLPPEERLVHGRGLRLRASGEESLDVLGKCEYRAEPDEGQIISFLGFGTIGHETIIANIIRLLGTLFLDKN